MLGPTIDNGGLPGQLELADDQHAVERGQHLDSLGLRCNLAGLSLVSVSAVCLSSPKHMPTSACAVVPACRRMLTVAGPECYGVC